MVYPPIKVLQGVIHLRHQGVQHLGVPHQVVGQGAQGLRGRLVASQQEHDALQYTVQEIMQLLFSMHKFLFQVGNTRVPRRFAEVQQLGPRLALGLLTIQVLKWIS